MEISFETQYDRKTLTAMAQALRKTVRRKRSRRTHIFGWIIVAIALLFSFWSSDCGFVIRLALRPILNFLAAVFLVVVLIWEDQINGYFAWKHRLPGTENATAVFKKDSFVSTTEIGTTAFQYDKIQMIAEGPDYFVFIFSVSHAQAYDKKSISGGTLEQFRGFIENTTGKHILKI